MIKAKATLAGERPLFLLGLSERNLQLLRQGRPIRVVLEEIGGAGEVLIVFGETEAEILDELSDQLGPDTIVRGSKDSMQ